MSTDGGCARCQTCNSNAGIASNLMNRRAGAAPNDVSLLTAIDGAVGHKMRIWTAQKKELEAQLEAKTKELNTVISERQIREETLKREMEDSKRKLEDRLRDLDDQVKTFRSQCEAKIKEEQQRSAKLHQELAKEVSQRDNELVKAKARLSESGKTIGVLETERVKLSSELRENRMQKESLQVKVNELIREVENLRSSSFHKSESVKEAEERLQHRVVEAEKRSVEQERLLAEHIARIDGLQKALMLSRQAQKQTVEEKRKLDEELAKKDYDVKRLAAELDGTKLALMRLTSEHSTCACRITDLQKAVNNLKSNNSNQSASNGLTSEQRSQIAELRRQVTQLGAKLESSRAERNELECRLAEADSGVTRWRETSESLKTEIARQAKMHDHEINDLRMQISQLESMLEKYRAQESQLKAQLQSGIIQDTNIQQQLEATRLECQRLRVDLSEARQRVDSLSQERASLFDQLAENGRLRFELDQTRRRLDETIEEAKQYKRLSSELRSRKKAPTAPSPAITISPAPTVTTNHQLNMPNQAVSLLSAESPTFVVVEAPSSVAGGNNNNNQFIETASVNQTTMTTSPAFRQIPLSLPPENQNNNQNNNRQYLMMSTEPSQIYSSASNLVSEDFRPKSSQSQTTTIAETESKSKTDLSALLPSSFLAEWEKHSAQEAKSLEAALSSQLNALTAASDKILSQICAMVK